MRLSVVMCTLDGASYLPEQLDSIGAQRQPPDELVVCDDGSTDGTIEIVRAFAERAPFPVTLRVNDTRLGVIRNFGQAVAAASGDWIALADQDDIWHVDKLERLLVAAERRPGVGLLFSDAVLIDEQGRGTGQRLWQALAIDAGKQRRLAGPRALNVLLECGTVTGSTAMFRASWRPLVLPFPDDLDLLHDAWLALMVGVVAPVEPVAATLMAYRVHSRQHTGLAPATARLRGLQRAWTRDPARATQYAQAITLLDRVRARLEQARQIPGREAAINRLRERADHLRLRESLAGRRRTARVLPVVGELVRGRYHRFGSGALSAGKDLLT